MGFEFQDATVLSGRTALHRKRQQDCRQHERDERQECNDQDNQQETPVASDESAHRPNSMRLWASFTVTIERQRHGSAARVGSRD
jgi:hypothetical protein